MSDKRLLANFTSLLFSNFSVQALRFFTVIILTRKLGPELFGAYNYILLLVSISAILVEFGLKSYAIREFSLNRGSWNLIFKVFLIRFFFAFFSVLVVGLLTYQAFRSMNLVVIALLFSFSLFIDAFLIDFVAIAQEKLHLQAIAQLFQAAFYLLVVYLVLNRFTDLNWIALAFSASHLLLIVPYFLGINKITKQKESHAQLKAVLVGGVPFLLATLLSTFQSQMDIFLLGQFHFNHLLGDYSACLKLLSIPLGVVNSFISSVQPKMAQNIEKKRRTSAYVKKIF